ncbi:MAG: metal-dependent hydrolase [Bacteroidetes bacterium]|nr:metal-dependent hydrolase [Bacteroidota bacterium]
MTGKTHLAGGIAAAALLHAGRLLPELSPLLPGNTVALFGMVVPVVLPGTLLSVFGALLPDIDEPESMISNSPRAISQRLGRGRPSPGRNVRRSAGLFLRTGNVLTRALAMIVRLFAGGHRAATHTLLIAAMLSVAAFFLGDAVGFPSLWIWFLAGYLSHFILDMMTPSGIELFWPVSRGRWHVLPSFFRMRTGESGDIALRLFLFIAAVALFLWPYVR